jgi:hypothetical protein
MDIVPCAHARSLHDDTGVLEWVVAREVYPTYHARRWSTNHSPAFHT